MATSPKASPNLEKQDQRSKGNKTTTFQIRQAPTHSPKKESPGPNPTLPNKESTSTSYGRSQTFSQTFQNHISHRSNPHALNRQVPQHHTAQRHTSKLGKSFGGTFKMKAHTTHSKGTPTEAHQTTSAHTTGSPARNIPQPAPVPQNHSAPTPECPNTRMPQHHSAKPPTPQCPIQQPRPQP